MGSVRNQGQVMRSRNSMKIESRLESNNEEEKDGSYLGQVSEVPRRPPGNPVVLQECGEVVPPCFGV